MTAVPLCGSYQVDLVVGDVFPTIQTRADGYAAKGKLLAAMIGPSEAKMMECGGKVTGGGFFDRNLSNDTDEDTDSFGFVAMQDAGDAAGKGHLNIIDHETGDHIQGWTVKNLIVNPAHTFARWSGRATFNGVDTTFTVEVQDLGEPGRDDTFKVVLGNGYTASGVLGDGGNIQIHKN
jgi:hypothetical protein